MVIKCPVVSTICTVPSDVFLLLVNLIVHRLGSTSGSDVMLVDAVADAVDLMLDCCSLSAVDAVDLMLDCCSLSGAAAAEGLVLSAGDDSTGYTFWLAEIVHNVYILAFNFIFHFVYQYLI